MPTFVTIFSFTFPHELAVVRGRLEAEGIECLVQDEKTIEAAPFYSNAIGGVKLQVKESDAPAALEILNEIGYKTETMEGDYDFFAEEPPVIFTYNPLLIKLVIAGLILAAIAGFIYFYEYLPYQGPDYPF